MRRHPTPHRDDRGVVAIELVLILPFLLMLIMGILVLGNALSVKAQVNELARRGARAAALGDDPNALGEPVGTFTVVRACPNPPTGDAVVQAHQSVSLRSIPLIGINVLPATITEEVRMRCGG